MSNLQVDLAEAGVEIGDRRRQGQRWARAGGPRLRISRAAGCAERCPQAVSRKDFLGSRQPLHRQTLNPSYFFKLTVAEVEVALRTASGDARAACCAWRRSAADVPAAIGQSATMGKTSGQTTVSRP